MTRFNILLCLLLVCAATVAQDRPAQPGTNKCPDWSPKFDEIDDQKMYNTLVMARKRGWQAMSTSGTGAAQTLQQMIAETERKAEEARTGVANARQMWESFGQSPKPAVGEEECSQVDGTDQALASLCEERTQNNVVHVSEGMLELMRCRAAEASGVAPLVTANNSTPVPSNPAPTKSAQSARTQARAGTPAQSSSTLGTSAAPVRVAPKAFDTCQAAKDTIARHIYETVAQRTRCESEAYQRDVQHLWPDKHVDCPAGGVAGSACGKAGKFIHCRSCADLSEQDVCLHEQYDRFVCQAPETAQQ